MVLLFHTTQAALQAEEILLDGGLEVDVVPRPEGVLGGLCGIALHVDTVRLVDVDQLLSAAGVSYALHVDALAGEASEAAVVFEGGVQDESSGPAG